MKIAYFDLFAGISGDMALGALIDSGIEIETLKTELSKIHLHGYSISAEKVSKSGISATKVNIDVEPHHHDDSHHHQHRSYTDIVNLINQSSLNDKVKKLAIDMFTRLGHAEAKVHGCDIESIHFHEVGAVDSIVDIVGTCICLDMLEIEKVYSSKVPTFTGQVKCEHGIIMLPAPATMEILVKVPWRQTDIVGELVTPTGAVIIKELAENFGVMPRMSVISIGYGSGTKDFGIPNVLRVVIGEAEVSDKDKHEEAVIIETNIDDMSPQIYEVLMERLFAAGALDVYLTNIQMKKNRPAVLVSVICKHDDINKLSKIIFEETSSIGVRIDKRQRICLPREIVTVETEYGSIKVKVSRYDGQIINIQPEYEDCKLAAAKYNKPFIAVSDAAKKDFLAL